MERTDSEVNRRRLRLFDSLSISRHCCSQIWAGSSAWGERRDPRFSSQSRDKNMVINSSDMASDQQPVVAKDSVVTFDAITDASSTTSSPTSLQVKEAQNTVAAKSVKQQDSRTDESSEQTPAETPAHHALLVRESHNHQLDDTASFIVEDELRSISAMDFGEVSGLMREQDADLLERHQSQMANDATPQLHAAIDPPPLPPPLTLEIPAKRPWRRQNSRVRSSEFETGGDGNKTATTDSIHPNDVPAVDASSRTTLLAAATSGDEDAETPQHRPFLAGEIFEQQISAPEEPPTAVADATVAENLPTGSIHEEVPTSTSGEILESVSVPIPFDHQDRTIENNDSYVNLDSSILSAGGTERPMRRTESMDRFVQLSEAAQFAEAVGDATIAEDLRILEEDRSDDDESDAQGTRLSSEALQQQTPQPVPSMVAFNLPEEKQRSNLPPALPIPPPSLESRPPAATSLETQTPSVRSSSAKAAVAPSAASLEPPKSPFKTTSLRSVVRRRRVATKRGFLDQLPSSQQQGQCDFVYKGLHANPPEIVKRGTNRGNYAQLHRKAWLEVSDKYHRYGKNLRFYYRHWESLGCPFNMFFDWLDSKGEAAGQPLPEIEKCPRAILDSDTVLYITDPEESEDYALAFVPDEHGRGRVVDPIDGEAVCTGPDGWIFVLRDNQIFGAQKITSATGHLSKQRFHHSSFFGGKAVAAAGIFITDDQGYLTRLYPHSGHYRPREAHMQRVLFFLHHQGVDLRTFDMDMQQILHVARDVEVPKKEEKKEENGDGENVNDGEEKAADDPPVAEKKIEKKKKVESLFLIPAVLAACFLAHKARFIGAGIFEQLHKIRRADVSTVSEALDFIEPPAEP